MRYVLFLAIGLILVALALLLLPAGQEQVVPQGNVLAAGSPMSGIACCTFEQEGRTRTCAVPQGQSCEVCSKIC